MNLLRRLYSPWTFIAFLVFGTAWSFAHTTPLPLDDHYNYQRFIETLASGSLDLSIPGFHGSDFLAAIWHLFSGSFISQIEFQIYCALLLPFLAYIAGRDLFKGEWEGVVFATIITMMPFFSFVALRGWTGPAFHCLLMLTIIASERRSRWTGVLFGFAIITKPFALALAPLLFINASPRRPRWKGYRDLYIGIGIAALYVLVQYVQVGHVIVGSHSHLNQANVWQDPLRIILNAAHSLQILFSVHNYYFPDPALTGPGNMLHTTPVLIFLGLWGMFHQQSFYKRRVGYALACGMIIGIGLNMLLDHMDHFYMEAGVLMLIFAAIPVLKRNQIWIPLVLATLHFQWFYFFLQYRQTFTMDYTFFLIPLIVDAAFLFWCVGNASIFKKEFSAITEG